MAGETFIRASFPREDYVMTVRGHHKMTTPSRHPDNDPGQDLGFREKQDRLYEKPQCAEKHRRSQCRQRTCRDARLPTAGGLRDLAPNETT